MSSTAPHYLSHSEILPVVLGAALCILLAALDQTIVIPAVPKMAAELHGASHLAWIITAYLVTGTAATPIFGKLSDIYGRRRLMQPALILFVAASIFCALAQTLPQLLFWRAIQGIGGAGLMTVAQTAIADAAPPRERGRYQIYMSGVWGISSLGGPLLGGALADQLSWRWIFWINLPLGALTYIVSSRALARLHRPPAKAAIDYAGAMLLMSGIIALLLLISSGGKDFSWASLPAAALAAIAAACFALMLAQERRTPSPMLPLHIFANKVVLGGLALSFCNSLITFGASLLTPLFFQYIRHTSAAASGLYATPFMLGFVIFSYLGGKISRRLGRTRPTMLAAIAACLLGMLLLATMTARTPIPLCIAYAILLGSGIGLVQPNITVAIQNAAARADVGLATGCMLLFRAIGGAAGATIAGAVLLAHGFPAAFAACAAFAAASLLIAARMPDNPLHAG